MPRNLDPATATALASGLVVPFFAASITFLSETIYVWSGPGSLVWNGQTYLGTADLTQMSSVTESSDVKATGTTLTLSGVDPLTIQESLEDVQIGAPCSIYFGLLNPTTGVPIGTPYPLFVGLVDKPSFSVDTTAASISLAIESHMIRLSQGQRRLYTSADQRIFNPTSTFFGWIETLNDLALVWGT